MKTCCRLKLNVMLRVGLLAFAYFCLYFCPYSWLGETNVFAAEPDAARIAELDAFWAEVSRTVKAGDFAGYAATCHEEGVLVTGVKKSSQPLSEALARWKEGIDATKAGKMKASVEFRFSQRLGDATTAHETGIFCYRSQDTTDENSEESIEYIHFEGLLVKRDGKWKTLMEYQKSRASQEEWDALK